jgi:hypothetical protein
MSVPIHPLELASVPLTWLPNISVKIKILIIKRGGAYAGIVGAASEEAREYYRPTGERLRNFLVHTMTASIDDASIGKYFPDLLPFIPQVEAVDRWWGGPTSLANLDDPTGTLADAVATARTIAAAVANVPEADVPSITMLESHPPPDTPEKKDDWKVVDPTVRTIQIHYDGQGWLVSAGKLIRPFRFAGHIAAEQYAAQVGERYNLPVKVV